MVFDNSECSAAWLAHLVWDQGVEGSNPFTPTIRILKNINDFMVGLAQLVRALVCGAGGRGFESRISPHKIF